jgi:hypothetical protein
VKGARGPLGIRLVDVGLAVAVLIAVEISVVTGGGPGAAPLDALAYVLGSILVLPVLLRNRWPRFELIACSVLGGSGTGAVSAGSGPVSSPRPSNRACGSPAHGLPTFFTVGVRPARARAGRAWAG